MMKRGPRIAVYIIALSILLHCIPSRLAHTKDSAFVPGEILEYKVQWEFVPAGQAKFKVGFTQLDKRQVYHFVLKATTNSFVNLFYKLDEKIESYTDKDLEHSYLYKERNKGSNEKKIVVFFDWTEMVVRYSNFGEKREPVPITQSTIDPLASFYALRTRKLYEGAIIEFPVTNGKKHFIGKVVVAGMERIEVNGKQFKAFIVKPDVNYFGGVFEKSKDPGLTLWLTADKRKIPVKIVVKVSIGSVIVELESITKPRDDVREASAPQKD